MKNYNINIRTESHIAETLKVDSDDLTGLRVELARFVGELLKDHAELVWVDEDWQIDVTDESGLILYIMQISAMETPATMTKKGLRSWHSARSTLRGWVGSCDPQISWQSTDAVRLISSASAIAAR